MPDAAVAAPGRAKSCSGAENRSNISRILYARQDDEQGAQAESGARTKSSNEVSRGMNQGSDPLRMFGVGKTFKQPVGGAQNGKSHLWSVDQRRKPFVMAFARFAEEHSLNAATRTERFFDKPHALDANESRFPSASRRAELRETP